MVSAEEIFDYMVGIITAFALVNLALFGVAYNNLYPCSSSKSTAVVLEMIAVWILPVSILGIVFLVPSKKKYEKLHNESKTISILYIIALVSAMAAAAVQIILFIVRQSSSCSQCPSNSGDPWKEALNNANAGTCGDDGTHKFNYWHNAKSYCNVVGACVNAENSVYAGAVDKSYCTYACPVYTYLPLNTVFNWYNMAFNASILVFAVLSFITMNLKAKAKDAYDEISQGKAALGTASDKNSDEDAKLTLHKKPKLVFPMLVRRNPTSKDGDQMQLLPTA